MIDVLQGLVEKIGGGFSPMFEPPRLMDAVELEVAALAVPNP
jgi:hypothetical protein